MSKKTVAEETQEHIERVMELIDFTIKEMSQKAIEHDASKLEEPELSIFAIYGEKLKNVTYGSEQYKKYLKEMKVALDHHYSVNRHHPEFFKNSVRGMNLMDLLEMICDWKAATERRKDGDVYKSIKINKERFGYSDELEEILLNTVKLLEKYDD